MHDIQNLFSCDSFHRMMAMKTNLAIEEIVFVAEMARLS